MLQFFLYLRNGNQFKKPLSSSTNKIKITTKYKNKLKKNIEKFQF